MKNKPTLFFIRHGHTEYNSSTGDSLDGRIRAYRDVPLDELGRRQAKEVAAKFKGIKIREIYTSDLSRASDTAKEIAKITGAPVKLTAALRPWDLGVMTGKQVRQCVKEMQRLQHEMDEPAKGGKSFREFYDRIKKTVEWLKRRSKEEGSKTGGYLVVVTHSRIMLSLPCVLSDGDPATIPQSGGPITGQVVEVQEEGDNWAMKTLEDEEAKEERGKSALQTNYPSHNKEGGRRSPFSGLVTETKRGKAMDEKYLSETLAKTARILCEGDCPNSDQELQAMVGDPSDVRTSTFAQFKPNPGTLQLPNPLSPVEGDEIFFAYMIPGAVMQAHDGTQWNIMSYGAPDEIEIENRWYPRQHGIVSIGDIRRSIDQWVEPIQQTVPPPPPGVDYSALPVKVMDKESNKGDIDTLTDNKHSDQTGGW